MKKISVISILLTVILILSSNFSNNFTYSNDFDLKSSYKAKLFINNNGKGSFYLNIKNFKGNFSNVLIEPNVSADLGALDEIKDIRIIQNISRDKQKWINQDDLLMKLKQDQAKHQDENAILSEEFYEGELNTFIDWEIEEKNLEPINILVDINNEELLSIIKGLDLASFDRVNNISNQLLADFEELSSIEGIFGKAMLDEIILFLEQDVITKKADSPLADYIVAAIDLYLEHLVKSLNLFNISKDKRAKITNIFNEIVNLMDEYAELQEDVSLADALHIRLGTEYAIATSRIINSNNILAREILFNRFLLFNSIAAYHKRISIKEAREVISILNNYFNDREMLIALSNGIIRFPSEPLVNIEKAILSIK